MKNSPTLISDTKLIDQINALIDDQLKQSEREGVLKQIEADQNLRDYFEFSKAQRSLLNQTLFTPSTSQIPSKLNPYRIERANFSSKNRPYANIACVMLMLTAGWAIGWYSHTVASKDLSMQTTFAEYLPNPSQAPAYTNVDGTSVELADMFEMLTFKALGGAVKASHNFGNYHLSSLRFFEQSGQKIIEIGYLDQHEHKIIVSLSTKTPGTTTKLGSFSFNDQNTVFWSNNSVLCTISTRLPMTELSDFANKEVKPWWKSIKNQI